MIPIYPQLGIFGTFGGFSAWSNMVLWISCHMVPAMMLAQKSVLKFL
jgi:hypothetical protein